MSSGAPCGACKFMRRKCLRGCIFAPYFGAAQGAAKFAAVHKIFGASNVAKLLLHIPLARRYDATVTISYEAQAWLSDPVYGCVATIYALEQQVASLQAELAMVQAANRQAAAGLFNQRRHLHEQQLQQTCASPFISLSPTAEDMMLQLHDVQVEHEMSPVSLSNSSIISGPSTDQGIIYANQVCKVENIMEAQYDVSEMGMSSPSSNSTSSLQFVDYTNFHKFQNPHSNHSDLNPATNQHNCPQSGHP